MNKSQLIASAALVVAIPVVALQYQKNTRLEDELEHVKSQRSARTADSRLASSARSRASNKGRVSSATSSSSFAMVELENIMAETDPVKRMKLLLEYAEILSPDQIPAMLAALNDQPKWGKGNPETEMIKHMLLTRWAQANPDAALASLTNFEFKSNGWNPHSILAGLTYSDPQRAAAWISDPESGVGHFGKSGNQFVSTVATEWARQNPQAAFTWAGTLPENLQAAAYSTIISQMAGRDPKQATTLAMSLEPSAARSQILGDIASSWARTSPSEVLAWSASLEGSERTETLREAIGVLAGTEPAAAAGYLDQISDQENIDPYLQDVASRWAAQQPAEAAEWVINQDEGEGRSDAMGHVMWNWGRQDAHAAGQWLSTQPEGESRDGAIVGFSKAITTQEPAIATEWANNISHENMRQTMTGYALGQWNRQNPEAAQKWAAENNATIPSGSGGK
jgi:hypothetical protein